MSEEQQNTVTNWVEEKDIKKSYKYVVIGDGRTLHKTIIASLRVFGMTKQPIPSYFYARDEETVNQIIAKMKPWHSRITVCKLDYVIAREGTS